MNYIRHLNAFFQYVRRDERLACSHVSLYLALFQYWNFNRFQNPFPVYRTDIMKLCKIGSKNTYHKCIKQLHEASYIIYHPALSPYQPVKISMIRLDKQVPKDPTQLDLFASSPPDLTAALAGGSGQEGPDLPRALTRGEKEHVPHLTPTSPNNDTNHVPKSGQLIKQSNLKTKECKTPTPGLPANPPQKQNPGQPHVPKTVHIKNSPMATPSLLEIQLHFKEMNYPAEEADKFFFYNQAKNWMLTEKFRIRNWKSLAKKWMLNYHTHHSPLATRQTPLALDKEIQYLYESWLEGKPVMHAIHQSHFNHLKLVITPALTAEATRYRINQLKSSNLFREQQLLMAYLCQHANEQLVLKDQKTLNMLAIKLAVINYFRDNQQEKGN